MARLEDLIANVPDAALRDALAHEVRALKEATSFGLVFERHLPENVLLPATAGVNVGDRVQRRDCAATDPALRVLARNDKSLVLVDEAGEQTEAPLDELLVVKGFGDAVFPSLRSLGTIERGGDRPWHAVIKGENYHALQVLLHTCEGMVDCIYIDPPYNSGARDWKYSNDYVDVNDRWRHSKWLSMMEKRLRMAKRLLKPDGVLICTIDENEVHHLGVLIEQLFPEYLRYMVNIVINPKGTNKANFGRVEEQAFFVVPDLEHEVIAHLPPPEEIKDAALTGESEAPDEDADGVWLRPLNNGTITLPAGVREHLGATIEVELTLDAHGARVAPVDPPEEAETREPTSDDVNKLFLRRRGAESSFRRQRPNQFYAIKVDEKTRSVVGIGPPLDADAAYARNRREGDILWIYPIDENGDERVWRYSRATMERYVAAGEIHVGRRWESKPQTYTLNHHKPRVGERVQRLRTTWWRTAHDAGTHGTTLLSRLLGTQSPFPFPKSLYAVRDCLEAVVRNRPDALIVDYFAGSGTTLHATALLNRADGGRRRCVLVTNNEVDEKTARALTDEGHLPGAPEFERHGIFEAATRPRVATALTGVRPDGTPVPGSRGYRYLDGRQWSDGFEENCEFLALEYLDSDDVELGRAFAAVHPLLWLTAGSRARRDDDLVPTIPFSVQPAGGYAVLFDVRSLREFVAAVGDAEGIAHVFLVTDSEDAFAEMNDAIGPGCQTHQLYRDYLRTFRLGAISPA